MARELRLPLTRRQALETAQQLLAALNAGMFR